MLLTHRSRRLRNNQSIRQLVKETYLKPSDLIQPLFVIEGKNKRKLIANMPDVFKLSIDNLVKKVKELYSLGIRCVMLFPCINPDLKNDYAPDAINPDNLMCRAIIALKKEIPEMIIGADVALDPYTIHGHDGVLTKDQKDIDNDATVSILVRQAKTLANAGADIICPSDMMDGRIEAIRYNFEECGFINTKIASYSIKYASNLYGPYRNALEIKDLGGPKNKKTYQMDFCNKKEALAKAEIDINEGADIIIIKPAGFYLDIIHTISTAFTDPIWGWQVSGEYAMINNMDNYDEIMFESLIAIKRSGAQNIITYGAEKMAKLLK